MNMPKKKGKKHVNQDFTINDCANAPKPIRVIRKPASVLKSIMEPSWDEVGDNTEISGETAEDCSKKLVHKKIKAEHIPVEDRPGIEYPEIIFYLISKYIRPEDIATFARINKSTYAMTKNKAFWTLQYKRHCENHPKLPEKLQADSLRSYALRQTVIRALFLTYDPFIQRILRQDITPHQLVSRICVNVWFCKGLTYWNVYFKLKNAHRQVSYTDGDFLEEMGRVDANPEEGNRVLLVTCKSFHEVPPLMGLTLTKVNMVLSQGYRHHRLHLGFTSTRYAIKGYVPECEVILDAVVGALVCDWWHPQYPHSGSFIPRLDPPLLSKNFFDDEVC